jgi:hypothetical protein
MGGLLPQQLQGLQQLRCLSVFGVGPAVELLGISKLTQLTAVSLTFELPDKAQGKKLLTQLGQLPQLQQLALPAKLLCGQCCPGASEHLQVWLCAEGRLEVVRARLRLCCMLHHIQSNGTRRTSRHFACW